MENMKKNYTGEVYGKNMWPAAKAYTSGKYKLLKPQLQVRQQKQALEPLEQGQQQQEKQEQRQTLQLRGKLSPVFVLSSLTSSVQGKATYNLVITRTLALEFVPALEAPPVTATPSLEDLDATTASLEVASKKMTPRRAPPRKCIKKVCTKIRKTPTKG